jgi:hypothetical protein
MHFGSYNTLLVSVNPTTDTNSPFSTTVSTTNIPGLGSTAVWATADLSDGRVCQSTAESDTDIWAVVPTPYITSPTVGTIAPDAGDTHTAVWEWGDGSTPGTVNESNRSVTDAHTH